MKCSSSQILWWSIGTICCVLLISQTPHFLKSIMNSVPTKESTIVRSGQDSVHTATNAKNVLVNFQQSKKPTYTNPSPDATLNDSSNCKKWAATTTKIGDRGQVTNDILNKNSKNDSDQTDYMSSEEKPDDSPSLDSKTEVTENHLSSEDNFTSNYCGRIHSKENVNVQNLPEERLLSEEEKQKALEITKLKKQVIGLWRYHIAGGTFSTAQSAELIRCVEKLKEYNVDLVQLESEARSSKPFASIKRR
eukprot:501353_1